MLVWKEAYLSLGIICPISLLFCSTPHSSNIWMVSRHEWAYPYNIPEPEKCWKTHSEGQGRQRDVQGLDLTHTAFSMCGVHFVPPNLPESTSSYWWYHCTPCSLGSSEVRQFASRHFCINSLQLCSRPGNPWEKEGSFLLSRRREICFAFTGE